MFPVQILGIEVKANFKSNKTEAEVKEGVNMFQLSRSHVNSHADLRIIDGSPIIKDMKLLGRIQLQYGW